MSELMLQQTQVATVVPYFQRFLIAFPTIADLAAADEQQVLRLWQGLGYYARARNLQAAARQVVALHAGQLPANLDALLALPGIGRYTAGAIASIAFDRRAPILDGNVMRVLCRLDLVMEDPRDRRVNARLWERAAEILPARRVGDFNSALMELGAMVCTPRNPRCLVCPVREHCKAASAGLQNEVPAPRAARPTPLVERTVHCIHDGDRWLIEQRPARGRWAGMWQFITVDGGDRSAALPVAVADASSLIATVEHALTHRRYRFQVFRRELGSGGSAALADRYRWTTLAGLGEFPLPRPHLKIAGLLGGA